MSLFPGLPAHRTWPDNVPPDNRTLGWHAIEWCSDSLLQPDGPNVGDPWLFTGEQVRFVLRWYEIDSNGRFTHRRGVMRRMKGHGKDPILAALGLCELCGPCRFAGWDNNGLPMAQPVANPLVQVAAVNLEQTHNTMSLLPAMVSDATRDAYGLDINKEVVYLAAGGALKACTSSPRSLQGARASFVILNETHEWVKSNDGHRMAEVIRANAAKSRDGAARSLEITNAHIPGEDSVAEATYDAWQRNVSLGTTNGLYYDSVEAPADTDLADIDSLTAGLTIARGDSTWLDIPRLIGEIHDPGTPPSVSRRYYLNQIIAAEDALYSAQEWDLCGLDDSLQANDTVVLGFDGGKTDDATALVAMRVADRFAEPVQIWERPHGANDWQVDQTVVDGVVDWAFNHFNVVAFYSDYHPWESRVDGWADRYRTQLRVKASSKHAVAVDMRGSKQRVTAANERLMAGVVDQSVKHNRDVILRRHALNCKRRLNQYGVSFGKENAESPHKVDAYAALMLADLARHDLVMAGKHVTPSRRVVVFR